jgi:ribose/xylose/arabinose/galactoside ABC-type transport system permease subunit
MTLNNHFDDFDFLSKSLKIMVACLIGELAAIAGIIAVETAAAATAWFGVGLVLGAIGAVVGGITIYKLKTKSK